MSHIGRHVLPILLLTLASPQRYYLGIGYGILLKGAGLDVLWREFLGLVVVAAGTFSFGAWRFLRQFD